MRYCRYSQIKSMLNKWTAQRMVMNQSHKLKVMKMSFHLKMTLSSRMICLIQRTGKELVMTTILHKIISMLEKSTSRNLNLVQLKKPMKTFRCLISMHLTLNSRDNQTVARNRRQKLGDLFYRIHLMVLVLTSLQSQHFR